MSEAEPSWFQRSKSWSTPRQVAFAASIIVVVALGASMVFGGRHARGVLPVLAQPADPTSSVAVEPAASSPTSSSSTSTSAAQILPLVQGPPDQAQASDQLSADVVLASIPIADEHIDGYDSDLFAVWSDLDDDGCDTRAEVLMAESIGLAQVDIFGCLVIAGDWLSAYDGVTVSDPTELDIDHLVPLGEVWKSGAFAWTVDERVAYGNDTSDPRTLLAVTAASNRSKGDRDPAGWMPDQNDVCVYLADWLAVKARWGLTMDPIEANRIGDLLDDSCIGLTIKPWTTPIIGAP